MTEEEAKQKWCPFTRNGNEAGCNRAGERNGSHPFNVCIGSECMAWRWDFEYSSMIEEGQGGDIVLRLKRLKGAPKIGYCGLAGKP